ncbi:MAG: ABC transporter ATP-binding protein [Gaiellaceae bacterium]
MATVTFDHVTKAYGDGTVAVDDLDLLVKDGEFLVLVGPSGCGKTTALRCLAGLEEITGGQIKIDARVVNRVPSKDRNIAMVFQSYALYPHMTVFDNLAFGLKLLKTPKQEIKRRVEEAAKILNLESLLDRKPRALSGGQRQRVALGRAIVREPAAFLMDEPLSNLDAKLRVQTRAEILRLQRRLETTTIYVTHDQVEAMTMGDRVAVMRDGVLQQVGAPQELYDTPANQFVAGFIGTPPMNLLEASVSVNGGVTIGLGGAQLPVPDEALKAYPKLRSSAGRTIVAGVRSQFLHPAAERPELPTIDGEVELVEALGSESIVYFKIDAFAIREGQHEEVAESPTSAEGIVASRPNLVAEFPAHTILRLTERVPVAVDVARMHFFDGETGEPLR